MAATPVHVGRVDALLESIGETLRRNQKTIQRIQWIVVGAYAVLLAAPIFAPVPVRTSHIWTNLRLFAQFVFWGLWWPFVLLSMILVGRAWCGLLCPEGALTEAVSRHGRGHAAPRWLTWRGWPFVAFACTTFYGQMVSVYQYPRPALVVLGGSTAAAMAVGYLWGRNKRLWCRYLCPVTGVFGVLSKLAPLHFRVDHDAWSAWKKPRGGHPQSVGCAPLVPIKTMKGGSLCHMCGRCSGFRGAVSLARRSPNEEIIKVAGDRAKPWESALILFGLIGIVGGAFHWTSSDLFVALKQSAAGWLVDHGGTWLMEPILPWFILTNYPAQNDMMTPLDGAVLAAYVAGFALLVGAAASLFLVGAALACGRWSASRWHHFAQALIPIAGAGVFLGLSALTVTMLRSEGLSMSFAAPLRAAIIAGAAVWSIRLGWGIAGRHSTEPARRVAATLFVACAAAIGAFVWASLFWPSLSPL